MIVLRMTSLALISTLCLWQAFVYPREAGFPMGPDYSAEFYILQIHYDLQDRTGRSAVLKNI